MTTLLVSIKVIGEAKLVKKGMLLNELSMISARRVAAMVPYLPRISETPTKDLADLSAILEKAEVWASEGVSITRIPIVGESVSTTIILMVRLTTRIN